VVSILIVKNIPIQIAYNVVAHNIMATYHAATMEQTMKRQRTWRERIEYDDSNVNGAMMMHVEHSHDCHHKDSSGNGQKLQTDSCNKRNINTLIYCSVPYHKIRTKWKESWSIEYTNHKI